MIRLFLVTAVALASLVASPVAREAQTPVPATPADPSAPTQADVEAQLAKMLEELRRDNARRGVKAESDDAPAARPAPAPVARPTPAVGVEPASPKPAAPPRVRVVPKLPAKPLVATRLSAPRLAAPPRSEIAPGVPSPLPPAPAAVAAPRETAAAARPEPPDAATAAAADTPRPTPSDRVAPAFVSGGLPDVDGFTSDEVRAFLGAPHTIQQGATGVTAWHYTTPAGRLPVYFVDDLATVTAPAARKGAPAPTPLRRVPGATGTCEGTGAVAGPKALVIATPDAPAFIEARFRQVPLAMLPRGAKLDVVSTEGAWYLVRFNDERWGKRNGYVHCSGVAVP